MKIEEYRFGYIKIDGKEYRKDVIITSNKVLHPWWRKEGHKLFPEDLQDILEEDFEIIVIGTGAYGMMKVPPETENFLKGKGKIVVKETTGQAVNIFNKFVEEGKKVVGAFHLTC